MEFSGEDRRPLIASAPPSDGAPFSGSADAPSAGTAGRRAIGRLAGLGGLLGVAAALLRQGGDVASTPWAAKQQKSDAGLPPLGSERDLMLAASSRNASAEVYGDVRLGVLGGTCVRSAGPLEDIGSEQPVDAAAKTLGMWRAKVSHILCVVGPVVDPKEVHFLANVVHEPGEGQGGEFGFGHGLSVGMRPEIATNALWRMSADIESIGLDIQASNSLRVLALRTLKEGTTVSDVPLVVARSRQAAWPVDVQFAFPRAGSCAPAAGSARFVCRANLDVMELATSFVAVCPSCASGEAGEAYVLSVRESGKKEAEAEVSDAPWVGWVTKMPAMNKAKEWTVTLTSSGGRRLEQDMITAMGQDRRLELDSVQVVLVLGETSLVREGFYMDHKAVQAACVVLSYIFWVACIAAAVGHGLMLALLPGPVVAVLPALSTSLAALHFVVLCTTQHVSHPLKDATAELQWILPSDPAQLLHMCGIFMATVLGVHTLYVAAFLSSNGKGSGSMLPYGLLFGAWELRGLSIVALPASAAASCLAMQNYYGYDFQDTDDPEANVFVAVLYGLLPVTMLVIGGSVLKRLVANFNDELVVALETARGDVIFVDRCCDQLRAIHCPAAPWSLCMPFEPLSSPSWSFAPPVCTIEELSHDGSQRHGRLGSWRTMWTDGPWTGTEMGRSNTENFAMSKRLSRHNSDRSGNDSIEYISRLSPMVNHHPIAASVVSGYKSSASNCFAGVIGLPWIDTAIPASALRMMTAGVAMLSNSADGVDRSAESMMCVHVGQMSGRLTDGRCAACFEWCDTCPLRWPVDLIVKVLLGCYVGSLRYTTAFAASSATALHWSVIAVTVLAGVAALLVLPYRAFVDNLCLAASCFAAAAAALSASAGGLAPVCAIGVAGLILVPSVRLAATSVNLSIFALRFKMAGRDMLPSIIEHWGAVVWDSARRCHRYTSPIVVKPTFGGGRRRFHATDIELPATIRGDATHLQILLPAAPSGVVAVPPKDGTALPRVPIPVDLLLAAPGPKTYKLKALAPHGAVMSADACRLLYSDPELNGDKPWQEVVKEMFPDEPDVEREIIRSMRNTATDQSVDDDCSVRIIEVIGGQKR